MEVARDKEKKKEIEGGERCKEERERRERDRGREG